MKIHTVSFQWPVPADYGGAIDVYHKLRALRLEGAEVALHSYAYGRRLNPDMSLSPAQQSAVYRRQTGLSRMFGTEPYIVASRRDRDLLSDLAALEPGTPVIFEGIHTCAFLNHPALADKIRIVRAHNVEHDYYAGLARQSKEWRKLYFKAESARLRRYAATLAGADAILAISPADAEWYAGRFPDVRVIHIPCFYDDSPLYGPGPAPLDGNDRPYLLYHGSLSVEENVAAVEYVAGRIMPLLPEGTRLVVAGREPSARIREALKVVKDAVLAESPGKKEMNGLIEGAAATILVTGQATGIKLKLLDTLARARGNVLVNTAMLGDRALKPLVTVADGEQRQAAEIRRMLRERPDAETLRHRREELQRLYGTRRSARKILDCIEELKKR